jgi:2-polyprenyl-3-methyl-5-hydroxy-6-metoxy-1,4-benzoquinol methylase
VSKRDLLSEAAAGDRYADERRQGEAIMAGGEKAWGWFGPAGAVRAERRADFLIRAAGLRPGVSCLELGCGTGEFTTRLLTSGCRLTAVELSEATAQRCRQAVRGEAEILLGNIETGEGYDGRTFDAIVGVSVLHHVNMDKCLRATFSRLKPGGRFAFSEPNMANPQIWLERHVGFIKKLRKVTPHETAFRVRKLRKMLERAGLVVEVCEPFEFLHPATPKPLLKTVLAVEKVLEKTPCRAIAGSIRVAGRRAA